MKVRDLLEEIKRCRKEYGDEFLDWNVYTEQLDEDDKANKKSTDFGGNWKTFTDDDEWEYFECTGFWTECPKTKIFTININY